MQLRRVPNPKRRLRNLQWSRENRTLLDHLAAAVRYGGNPEHKRNPGDFGLDPPSRPRPDKSLCDDAGIFDRGLALALLREGLRRGWVSEQQRNGWPQNIWAVTAAGIALEAQREGDGIYHGYPLPANDPLRESVLRLWSAR